jgi:predicted porin
MKKSLLALAVLGAFAGAASAQSSVTVYGIVDTGIASTDTGATNGRSTAMISGGQSASRIGFKGTEDLGNGLKANFVLESGFSSDSGDIATGTLFNRVSTLGLSGGFGAFNAGKQTTVLKDAHDQIDPFGAAGIVGNIERIFYNARSTATTYVAGPGARPSNSLKYSSNSFGGFKAQAQYTFGEQRGDNGAGAGYGLGLGYANGPLNVQFGYNDQDFSAANAVTTTETKNAFLGATYDFGGFKLHGAYADTKAEIANAETKARNAMVGVSVKLGAGTLLASYAINDNKTTGAVNADAKQVAIGYTYDLSKRTNLYTGYSRTSNDANSNVGSSQLPAPGAVANGNDVSTLAVGIRHKF